MSTQEPKRRITFLANAKNQEQLEIIRSATSFEDMSDIIKYALHFTADKFTTPEYVKIAKQRLEQGGGSFKKDMTIEEKAKHDVDMALARKKAKSLAEKEKCERIASQMYMAKVHDHMNGDYSLWYYEFEKYGGQFDYGVMKVVSWDVDDETPRLQFKGATKEVILQHIKDKGIEIKPL